MHSNYCNLVAGCLATNPSYSILGGFENMVAKQLATVRCMFAYEKGSQLLGYRPLLEVNDRDNFSVSCFVYTTFWEYSF